MRGELIVDKIIPSKGGYFCNDLKQFASHFHMNSSVTIRSGLIYCNSNNSIVSRTINYIAIEIL